YDFNLVKNGLVDSQEMDVHKRYGWNNNIADKFYTEYTATVLNNAPIKPGAKYVIDELKKQGHKLVCITLRGYYRQCEIDITEQRLKDAGIQFDKIYYKEHNKVDTCKMENVDFMIEDSAKNIQSLIKEKIKCLYFRAAGLKSVESDCVTEVQNWAQILEIITKNTKKS
ncbi:MAG: hypothetical protein J6Q51_03030, partial [Clostridia bacterium]|nr:hypothetical protein [Clostridia bacterium]